MYVPRGTRLSLVTATAFVITVVALSTVFIHGVWAGTFNQTKGVVVKACEGLNGEVAAYSEGDRDSFGEAASKAHLSRILFDDVARPDPDMTADLHTVWHGIGAIESTLFGTNGHALDYMQPLNSEQQQSVDSAVAVCREY